MTALGRRQANCLADHLRTELREEPSVLICSDLKRALETADVIGQALDVEPQPTRSLREFNTGIAAWKTQDWAKANAAPEAPTGRGLDRVPFPEAETGRIFYDRVARCVDEIHRNQDKLMVVVSHGGTTNVIIAWWLGLEVEEYDLVDFLVSPAGITVLRENELGQRTLYRLNDLSHLYKAGLKDREQMMP